MREGSGGTTAKPLCRQQSLASKSPWVQTKPLYSYALIQLYDKWITAVENGEFTTALLLDLSTAFDLGDHQILLGKLRPYNFSDETISWE